MDPLWLPDKAIANAICLHRCMHRAHGRSETTAEEPRSDDREPHQLLWHPDVHARPFPLLRSRRRWRRAGPAVRRALVGPEADDAGQARPLAPRAAGRKRRVTMTCPVGRRAFLPQLVSSRAFLPAARRQPEYPAMRRASLAGNDGCRRGGRLQAGPLVNDMVGARTEVSDPEGIRGRGPADGDAVPGLGPTRSCENAQAPRPAAPAPTPSLATRPSGRTRRRASRR
jgi:hypothetical protein